mmetsp:Transcript_8151/g.27679  ORF Transcript_8151/g.27679 Transcript_8151/m.27679 type:complete len:202 (+) Transcript_8151:249-854(+)
MASSVASASSSSARCASSVRAALSTEATCIWKVPAMCCTASSMGRLAALTSVASSPVSDSSSTAWARRVCSSRAACCLISGADLRRLESVCRWCAPTARPTPAKSTPPTPVSDRMAAAPPPATAALVTRPPPTSAVTPPTACPVWARARDRLKSRLSMSFPGSVVCPRRMPLSPPKERPSRTRSSRTRSPSWLRVAASISS